MKQLDHSNILPFYGASGSVADLSLVFPWYENGNIMDYLNKQPDIDRFALVSTFEQTLTLLALTRTHEQLSGVACGLRFLHENGLIHGALKPVCDSASLSTRINVTNRVTY